MKIIAALLLTIALAMFPLSGSRAMASVGAHAQAVAESDGHHDHAAVHQHEQTGGHETRANAHPHEGLDDHGQQDASKNPCAGDHAASSCCSLSCHAMAPQVGVGVPAQRHAALTVGIFALPLPRGVGFDGLLRPPKPA
jgi:hypothetical protein